MHDTRRGERCRPFPGGHCNNSARASEAERLSVLHDLFYTAAWPHPPEDSSLLGDASMTSQEQAAHRKASRHHDAWAPGPSITAPTLVLHGEVQ